MATLNWTHVGQYRPYGDTFRVCEIHTDERLTDNEVLDLVNEHRKRPKEEFDKGCKDILEHFRGWYTIERTDYGYLYTGCKPYDDLSYALLRVAHSVRDGRLTCVLLRAFN